MKVPTPRIATGAALISILGSMLALPAVFAQDTAERADRPALHADGMHGPGMGGARHRRGGPGQDDPDNMIEQLDSDGDGKLSSEEFIAPQLARVDNMFERRDTNDDGVITAGEDRPERLTASGNPSGRGNRMDRLQRLDIDGEELSACVRRSIADFEAQGSQAEDDEDRFASNDTNNDGSLSLAEVSAAAQARAQTRFDKFDSSGDGFITAEEIAALQQVRQQVRAVMRACVKELAAG